MSMNCKKAEEHLVEYLYQELSAGKTLQIEKHLKTCRSCARTLENWRAIHRGYQQSSEDSQVSPFLKQRILAAAEEELRRSPSWSERIFWGVKILAVPVALFVILLVLNIEWQNSTDVAMTKQQAEPSPAVSESKAESPKPVSSVPDTKLYDRPRRDDTDKPREESGYRQQILEKGKDIAAETESKKQYAASPSAPPLEQPAASEPEQLGAAVGGKTAEVDEIIPQQKTRMAFNQTVGDQFNESQVQLQKNDVKRAKEIADSAISNDPNRSLASQFHQYGVNYQNQGEYGKAILNFQLVQSNYRDYRYIDDVLLGLGDSFAEVGEFDKAEQAYKQMSTAKQSISQDRIRRLTRKKEAQEQLKSLGYVDQK